MRKILTYSLFFAWGCSPNNQGQEQQSNTDPCPREWIATGKQLTQIKVNDTTERAFLNDTLWFEVIGNSRYKENQYTGYLKNYRTNGLLQNEGIALYADHPIADYVEHGEWKYYDCQGTLLETKKFFEGKLIPN